MASSDDSARAGSAEAPTAAPPAPAVEPAEPGLPTPPVDAPASASTADSPEEKEGIASGNDLLSQALERLEDLTLRAPGDDATKQKLQQLVAVLEQSAKRGDGSRAVQGFLEKNSAVVERAKSTLASLGTSVGIEIDDSIADRIRTTSLESGMNQLRELLAGTGQEGDERSARVGELLSSGKTFMEELATSDEAKQLQEEGMSTLQMIKESAEGKRLMEAAQEILEQQDLSALLADAPERLQQTLEQGRDAVSTFDVSKSLEQASEMDTTGIARSLIEGNEVAGPDATPQAEAAQKLMDELGAADALSSATQRAKEAVAAAKEADPVNITDTAIEKGSKLLEEARRTRKGQHIIGTGLKYLRTGIDKGVLQGAMREIGSAEMVDLGKRAINDPVARSELLSRIRDSSIKFVVNSLPAISIPPISGHRENVAYTIDGLNLRGFVINGDKIKMTWGTPQDANWNGEVLHLCASDITANVEGLTWSYRQSYFPYLSGEGLANCIIEGLRIDLGFKLVRRPAPEGQPSAVQSDAEGAETPKATASAGEQIHLVLASKSITVEELNLEVKGTIMSWVYNMLLGLFAEVVRGYIVNNVLEELEDSADQWLSRLNDTADTVRLGPILSNVLKVSIDRLEVMKKRSRRDSSLVLVNSDPDGASADGAHIYEVTIDGQGPLGLRIGTDPARPKEAVVIDFVRTAGADVPSLAEQTGKICVGDVPVGVDGVTVEGKPVAAVIKAFAEASRPITIRFRRGGPGGGTAASRKQAIVEVVFGPGPLGLELTSRTTTAAGKAQGAMIRMFKPLQNGEPGPAERSGKLKPSMVLASCNGAAVYDWMFKDIMDALRRAARPMILTFRHDPDTTLTFNRRGPLGLRLAMFDESVIVTGFVQRPGAAEKSGLVRTGHVVHCVAGRPVTTSLGAARDLTYHEVIRAIKSAERPFVIRFGPNVTRMDVEAEVMSPGRARSKKSAEGEAKGDTAGDTSDQEELGWCDITFPAGPLGITFGNLPDGRAAVVRLPKIHGLAKSKGDIIQPGMALLSINGESLEGLEFKQVIQRISTATLPRTITFRDMDLYSRIKEAEAAAAASTQDAAR